MEIIGRRLRRLTRGYNGIRGGYLAGGGEEADTVCVRDNDAYIRGLKPRTKY